VTRRTIGGGAVVLVAAAAIVAGATGHLGTTSAPGTPGASASTPDARPAASSGPVTEAVSRRTLQVTADLSGALGYGATRTLAAPGQGTLTRIAPAGTLVSRGQALWEVDGHRGPSLLYGSRPLWRDLRARVKDGADVLEVEQNLAALGVAPKGMKVNRHWDAKTTAAVRRWQRKTGQPRTGVIRVDQIVMAAGPLRLGEAKAALGAMLAPGTPVVDATGSERTVTLSVSLGKLKLVPVGASVTVEFPDGTTTQATVRGVGRTVAAGGQGSPDTVEVVVAFAQQASLPAYDAAPVTVHVATASHANVLAVPVASLVALLEGGYAVEVVAADGSRHYVGVTTGMDQDGWIEVTGTGLAEGDKVVMPS
jgi:hypothetical protein